MSTMAQQAIAHSMREEADHDRFDLFFPKPKEPAPEPKEYRDPVACSEEWPYCSASACSCEFGACRLGCAS